MKKLIFILLVISFHQSFSIDPWWSVYIEGNVLPSDYVGNIVTAPDGKVYIGTFNVGFGYTNGGLAIFDGANWQVIDDTNTTVDNNISHVAVDKSGKIFVSYRDNGCAVFDGSKWNKFDMSGIDTSIKFLDPIIFDKNGKMWAGLHKKTGLVYTGREVAYYDSLWHVIRIDTSKTLSFDIYEMIFDKNNNLFIATSQGVLKLNAAGSLSKIDTNSVYNPKPNSVTDLAIDDSGVLWISTMSGIYSYDGNSWINYNKENSNLPENRIYSLLTDRNNTLWIGTEKNGLVKLDNAGMFTKFFIDEWKYYDAIIRGIVKDSSGNIWMKVGSIHGVAVLRPNLLSIGETEALNGIFVNPNPALDYIEVFVNNSLRNINIYNAFGELKISAVAENGELYKVDISRLVPGFHYIIAGDKTGKFIKL